MYYLWDVLFVFLFLFHSASVREVLIGPHILTKYFHGCPPLRQMPVWRTRWDFLLFLFGEFLPLYLHYLSNEALCLLYPLEPLAIDKFLAWSFKNKQKKKTYPNRLSLVLMLVCLYVVFLKQCTRQQWSSHARVCSFMLTSRIRLCNVEVDIGVRYWDPNISSSAPSSALGSKPKSWVSFQSTWRQVFTQGI